MPSDKHSSKKREHSRERHKDRKKRKHEHKHNKKDKSKEEHLRIVDDDVQNADLWLEKDITLDGEHVVATDIPTAESLKLKTSAEESSHESQPAEAKLQRDEWMLMPNNATGPATLARNEESLTEDYGEPTKDVRTMSGSVDFFSSLGTEHKRRDNRPQRPDPDKPTTSSKELNKDIISGKSTDVDETRTKPASTIPGGPGSSWRMMRLRRVYETVEEEGRSIEDVGIERFGTLEAFEEAQAERRILDEREASKRGQQRGRDSDRGRSGGGVSGSGEKGFMFHDFTPSGGSSRSSSFRRPGESGRQTEDVSGRSTPSAGPSHRRVDALRGTGGGRTGSPLAQQQHTPQSRTPIPSVLTPSITSSRRALSPTSLNRLQAKVLRAKLMTLPDAEKLEKEYEEELAKARGTVDERSGVRTKLEVLPTLNAHGRLYDVGTGAGDDDDRPPPGNRKKKERAFETHDRKTGEVIRINPDDDTLTLGEMLRQEKFGAGMTDQKNIDAQFARAVMTDGKFENDLDYIDDNAEKLARAKMRSDAMKRQFAIHDYKRTQKVLATCPFCFGEDDSPPKAPVIAMGTRVYLSCTTNEELVQGHCLIVPIQHHLTMLEGDDDVWDEVRNFMKSLMRMFSEQDKGVVFYETVISLKRQAHTFVECVPLPWEQYDVIPGYFKESILTSEAEWSQHRKLIDFSARPGGFRRAMVPNLPYFMVQFDYKGEKGYGHVIEGASESLEDGEEGMDEGEKGGGEFPRWFAGEIIGNLLDLEPRRWRSARRIDFRSNKDRVGKFRRLYDQYDWTSMI
ncbi:Protein similar to CwfJ C-terminus 1 domain containing protein [Amanita muscaria]